MQKVIKTLLFLVLATSSFAQTGNWTKDETQYYATLKSLFAHFKEKSYDTTQRDFVFKKFVYFDYVLEDTSIARMQERTKIFDGLFTAILHFVDSVGPGNLDAKPTRFFKDNEAFFQPYNKGRELNELLHTTLTYFDRRRPGEPIGTLLFEPKTHKLAAWIVLRQGGYHYFLTFNLF